MKLPFARSFVQASDLDEIEEPTNIVSLKDYGWADIKDAYAASLNEELEVYKPKPLLPKGNTCNTKDADGNQRENKHMKDSSEGNLGKTTNNDE